MTVSSLNPLTCKAPKLKKVMPMSQVYNIKHCHLFLLPEVQTLDTLKIKLYNQYP